MHIYVHTYIDIHTHRFRYRIPHSGELFQKFYFKLLFLFEKKDTYKA